MSNYQNIGEVTSAYFSNEFDTKLKHISISKKLKEGYVFNENQSVILNKEKVNLYNEEIDKQIKEYRDDVRKLKIKN